MNTEGNEDDESKCQVGSPIYLIKSTERCWRCRNPQSVIALASRSISEDEEREESAEDTEPFILSNISSMPDEILEYLISRFPRCRMHTSRMAGYSYFTNFCECGANFGDFYLHCEPGGAFFPTSTEEAGQMTFEKLPFEGNFEFECSPSYGTGGLIFQHGKQVGGDVPNAGDGCVDGGP